MTKSSALALLRLICEPDDFFAQSMAQDFPDYFRAGYDWCSNNLSIVCFYHKDIIKDYFLTNRDVELFYFYNFVFADGILLPPVFKTAYILKSPLRKKCQTPFFSTGKPSYINIVT